MDYKPIRIPQKADWSDLRFTVNLITLAFRDATQATFSRTDGDGFVLTGVVTSNGGVISDGPAFDRLSKLVSARVRDVASGDVMEESADGDAVVDLRVRRPRQRFRIIRGKAANFKTVYYDDQATVALRARHFANVDGENVLLEIWTQDVALHADPINRGWGLYGVTEPDSTTPNGTNPNGINTDGTNTKGHHRD